MSDTRLPDANVFEAVRRMAPVARWKLLCELAGDTYGEIESLTARNEERIRQMARQRGLDWDTLSDAERLALVEQIAG